MLTLKLQCKITALALNAMYLLECADELRFAPPAMDDVERMPFVSAYFLRREHRDAILARLSCPLEQEAFHSAAMRLSPSQLTTRVLYALRGQAAGVAAHGKRLLREANMSLSDVRVYGCPRHYTEKPNAELLRNLRILHLNLGVY